MTTAPIAIKLTSCITFCLTNATVLIAVVTNVTAAQQCSVATTVTAVQQLDSALGTAGCLNGLLFAATATTAITVTSDTLAAAATACSALVVAPGAVAMTYCLVVNQTSCMLRAAYVLGLPATSTAAPHFGCDDCCVKRRKVQDG